MEGLGAAASAIALCQALKTLAIGIQLLLHTGDAPAEIYDLHNESTMRYAPIHALLHKPFLTSTEITADCPQLTTLTCYLGLTSSTLRSWTTTTAPRTLTGLDHLQTVLARLQQEVLELQQFGNENFPSINDPEPRHSMRTKIRWMFETGKISHHRNKIRREREHIADAFLILQQSQA